MKSSEERLVGGREYRGANHAVGALGNGGSVKSSGMLMFDGEAWWRVDGDV